jgi:ribosomal protein L33
MASDVRIAVTLACTDCKRRNYQTNKSKRNDPERIELRSWSPRDAVLVLSERDYPGWSARVDGQPSKVLRADYILRGVYLPAGRHEIELSFDPPGFALGVELAGRVLAALLLLVALRVALALLVGARRWGGILARRPARRRGPAVEALPPREEPTGAR